MDEALHSLFNPPMPPLDDLFREASPCHCQPGKDEFVAIPNTGAHLVQDGRTAAVADHPEATPFDRVLGEAIRSLYVTAARILGDAPPRTLLEARLVSDLPAGRRTFVTQVFQRGDGEVPRG